MDLSLFGAGAQSLGIIKTLAEGLLSSRDTNLLMETRTTLLSKVFEVQATLFELSAENHSLLNAKHAAENEVLRLTQLQAERERYELHEVISETYVYAVKPADGQTHLPPYLCQPCYDKGAKVVLRMLASTKSRGAFLACVENKEHSIRLSPDPRIETTLPRSGSWQG